MNTILQNKKVVLIYDGNCPFCLKSINWIKKNSLPNQFEYLTCQSQERKQLFPALSEETCMQAIQLVLPNQRILSGADAIPEILNRLQGWNILESVFHIPGVHWLAPYVYRWVANNRYRISCLMKP